MVIASLVMTTACTDEGPESMLTANADVTISKLTPTGVAFSVNDKSSTKASSVYIVITDETGAYMEKHQQDLAYVEFYSNQGYCDAEGNWNQGFFVPKSTYNYKVYLEYEGESWHMSSGMEVATGSFTVPTLEEYFKETYGESTMEVSLVTGNSALLTANLPDGVLFTNNKPTLLYSKSPDFANAKSVAAEDNEYAYWATSSCSFSLINLEEQTTYYVKVVGDFHCVNGDDEIWLSDADLTFNPGSFTTLSTGEVISGAKCKLSVNYMLDYFGAVNIALPDTWSFYNNDRAVCEVIYSTDPNFEHYEVLAEARWNDNRYWCNFTDLTPETTYYMALKGDFSCKGVTQVLKDLIIPADNSFTTHANRIEMVDGHACVDLGLSVKWAVDNVTQGSEEYFAWPEIYGVADIAGTEHDIATNVWGGSWQMPSEAQFKELIDQCDVKVDLDDNLLFIGPNGSYLTLEAKGYKRKGLDDIFEPSFYDYWTSTMSSQEQWYAMAFRCHYFTDILDYKEGAGGSVIQSNTITVRFPIRAVTTN